MCERPGEAFIRANVSLGFEASAAGLSLKYWVNVSGVLRNASVHFPERLKATRCGLLRCWCSPKWHSLQRCYFWRDQINEVRCACVWSHPHVKLFLLFCFFTFHFFKKGFSGHACPKWLSVFVMDSQCRCQLVSVESHCTVCRDAPWRGAICPRSLTTIWVWFGPVSMTPIQKDLRWESLNLAFTLSFWKQDTVEQRASGHWWSKLIFLRFFHCGSVGKNVSSPFTFRHATAAPREGHLSCRSLREWMTVAEASSQKYYHCKYSPLLRMFGYDFELIVQWMMQASENI